MLRKQTLVCMSIDQQSIQRKITFSTACCGCFRCPDVTEQSFHVHTSTHVTITCNSHRRVLSICLSRVLRVRASRTSTMHSISLRGEHPATRKCWYNHTLINPGKVETGMTHMQRCLVCRAQASGVAGGPASVNSGDDGGLVGHRIVLLAMSFA